MQPIALLLTLSLGLFSLAATESDFDRPTNVCYLYEPSRWQYLRCLSADINTNTPAHNWNLTVQAAHAIGGSPFNGCTCTFPAVAGVLNITEEFVRIPFTKTYKFIKMCSNVTRGSEFRGECDPQTGVRLEQVPPMPQPTTTTQAAN